MAHWYHIETTLRDGTTWRTVSPIPSLASAAEWVATTEPTEWAEEVVRIEIKRYDD